MYIYIYIKNIKIVKNLNEKTTIIGYKIMKFILSKYSLLRYSYYSLKYLHPSAFHNLLLIN